MMFLILVSTVRKYRKSKQARIDPCDIENPKKEDRQRILQVKGELIAQGNSKFELRASLGGMNWNRTPRSKKCPVNTDGRRELRGEEHSSKLRADD